MGITMDFLKKVSWPRLIERTLLALMSLLAAFLFNTALTVHKERAKWRSDLEAAQAGLKAQWHVIEKSDRRVMLLEVELAVLKRLSENKEKGPTVVIVQAGQAGAGKDNEWSFDSDKYTFPKPPPATGTAPAVMYRDDKSDIGGLQKELDALKERTPEKFMQEQMQMQRPEQQMKR